MKKIIISILFVLLVNPVQAQQLDKFKPSTEQKTVKEHVKVPHTVPAYKQLAAIYYSQKDWKNYQKAIVELARMLPYDGWIQYRLAGAYAAQDNKRAAFDMLLKMQDIGFSFDLDASPDFENLKNTGLYGYLQKGFATNAEAGGSATLFHTTKKKNLLADALAYDKNKKNLYLGSINTGEIWQINSKGKEKLWLKAGKVKAIQSISDLFVDSKNNLLWVVSNPSSLSNQTLRSEPITSAIIALNLKTRKPVSIHHVHGDQFKGYLSALSINKKGDIFVTDMKKPFIYTLDKKSNDLVIYTALKGFNGFRGITSNDDGTRLYLSDYDKGLVTLDQSNGKVEPLQFHKPIIIGGVEELYFAKNSLYIVQPGMYPPKIIQFNLDPSGLKVIGLHTLGSALEQMNEPTAGAVGNNGFFFIGNSQWSNFGKNNKRLIDKDEPTYILHANWEAPPEAKPQPQPARKESFPMQRPST